MRFRANICILFKMIVFRALVLSFQFYLIQITHSNSISEFEASISGLNLNYDSYDDEHISIADPGDDTEYNTNYLTDMNDMDGHDFSTKGFSSRCEEKRFNAIFRGCSHRTRFTETEINRVKQWVQRRIASAAVKPQKPACKTLNIRHDFKCLSHEEKVRFINAFIKIYRTGLIETLAYYHHYYWGSWHKCADADAAHIMMVIAVEKELLKITKNIAFPYWDNSVEFFEPEKSIIWDYFGHFGTARNGYCIPDGPFKNVTVRYPVRGCIRRQKGTDSNPHIYRWEGPEAYTSWSQKWPTDFVNWFAQEYNQHFKKHLYVAGDHGYMGIPWAAIDPLFWLFHVHQVDHEYLLKWNFIAPENILAFDNLLMYDYVTNTTRAANTTVDTIHYFNTTTIVSALQVGYGEVCYVTDQLAEYVLNLLDNAPQQTPLAITRMRQVLPPPVFEYFFPITANNNTTPYLMHDLAVVPDCPQQTCKPLPNVVFFNATQSGRNQYNLFRNAIYMDVTYYADLGEAFDRNFTETLNYYNYCSPYAF